MTAPAPSPAPFSAGFSSNIDENPAEKRTEAIAIVGAAGLFPEAPTLAAFHENLLAGRDSVRPLPAERVQLTCLDPDVEYPEIGCLDRIDRFDPAFFTISRREAEIMDPHQRLTLQLVCAAIENAGYALGSLRGTRTAVVLSAPRSEYARLIRVPDALELLGTEPAALAGRIAYALDLQGPALVIDAGCAASLVAVHNACRELASGEVDVAIAGGFSVAPVIGPRNDNSAYSEIMSPDGRCKAFDASANGAGLGEGGAVLVLKRLDRATQDGDHVHAVIRGSAVNQNGSRSNGLAAPSPSAQTEVILDAWRRAGVDPRTIGYVETHGSGTRLGDVIEVQGLAGAFAEHGVPERHCPIGSVKANIGHLDHAAGIAGLVRAMLSVQHGALYPSLHFAEPNPLIDFDRAAVYVNTEARPWAGDAGGEPRRAGVSSFSLAGTNVHMLLEQAPEVRAPSRNGSTRAQVVTVSAKSRAALERYRESIASWCAAQTDCPVGDVAHVLNRGRDDHPWRVAVTAHDAAELAAQLRAAPLPDAPARNARPVVLLFSGDTPVSDEDLAALADAHPAAADAIAQVAKLVAGEWGDAERILCLHHAALRVLRALGVRETSAIGSGAGNLAVRIAREGLDLETAVAAAATMTPTAELDRGRLGVAIDRLGRDAPVYVEMSTGGVLSRELARLDPALDVLALVGADGEVLAGFAALYRAGVGVDWDRHYEGSTRPRLEAPTYPFDQERFWCREIGDVYRPDGGERAPAVAPAPASALLATSIAEAVARVWHEALKATDLDAASDYFALGGTSITGMAVLDGVERDLGVRLSYTDLYDHPTLGELAAHIERRRAGAPVQVEPAIVPVPRTGALPLSFGQEQIWFLDQLNPASALYSIPMDLHLAGPVDSAALGRALAALARRHEVLRTRFGSDDGRPYAVIDDDFVLELPVVDLSGLDADERRRRAGAVFDREAVKPFDLAAGPLARATLVRLSDEEHVLILVLHHIIYDGWTPFVIQAELSELYRADLAGCAPELPELTIQYADFAAWQRAYLTGDVLEADLAYWREHLRGAPTLELPTDRSRPPVQSYAGDLVEFQIPADVARSLRALGRNEGVTTFAAMLAAVDVLLARYSGQEDIVVGSPTSGRRRAETRQLIGYFNNMMPLRTDLRGDPTFRELLHRTGAVVAGGLDHDEVPLEKIVRDLSPPRDASRHPFFDVAYSHQNAPTSAYELPGVDVVGYFGGGSVRGIAPGTSKFDLTIGVADQDDGAMEGYFEFVVDLFDRSTIERMIDNFLTLLRSIVSGPDARLSELEVLSPAEQTRLEDFATAPRAYALEPLVPDLVAEQARRSPDAVAVSEPAGDLTYGELDRAANRLARHLVALGAGPDRVVVLFLPKSAPMVVAALAVLRAGAAYAAVDPAYPDARVAHILTDAGAAAVVTSAALAARLPAAMPTVRVDADDAAIAAHASEPLPARATPESLAYLVYTSGSTGTPKGVQVEHRNLANLVRWHVEEFAVTPADRASQIAGVGFDAAVWELWPYLCTGASVHVPEADTRVDPVALREWLDAARVTLAFLPTPVAESLLADSVWPESLALRILFCGGDKLLRRPPPGLGFDVVDLYGPSECTVISTFSRVAPAPAATAREIAVPDIGGPIANAEIRILDRHLRAVPVGAWGELCVGGEVVGRGYRGRPELTAERFVPDPSARVAGARLYRSADRARWSADGRIEFGGRTDHMVKVRAFRIELGEIEAVLASHPAVREAVVLARPAPSGQKRLVAYVVAAPPGAGAAVGRPDLEAHLARVLPDYMVPERFVVLDALPLTAHGKIDRDALPEPEDAPALAAAPDAMPAPVAPASPRDPVETTLAGIWCDVLGVARVEPADNFFDLGGDSIQSIQIVARAARAGIRLTPTQLFQHQTVTALARAVRDATPADAPRASVAAAAAPNTFPLTPVQRGMLFHSLLDPGCYVEQVRLPITGPLDVAALDAAWRAVVATHEVLRTAVAWQGLDEPVQVVHDAAAPALTRLDWRAARRHEIDARVQDFLTGDVGRGVDVASAPLGRVTVLALPADESVIVFTHHHLLLDGWSAMLLLGDLVAAYVAISRRELPVLPPRRPFRDYAEWIAAHDDGSADSYWAALLGDFDEPVGLPGRLPDIEPDDAYGEVTRTVDEATLERLRAVARAHRVTLNTTVQAAWAWMLARSAARDDVVFGVTASARPPDLDGAEDMLGLLITTLPLRVRVPDAATGGLGAWLAALQEQSMTLLQLAASDPARVRRSAGVPTERPLFESIVAFESFPADGLPGTVAGITLGEPATIDRSSYPLALAVGAERDLQLVLHHDTRVLDQATAAAVLDLVVGALVAIADGHDVDRWPLPAPGLQSDRLVPAPTPPAAPAPSGAYVPDARLAAVEALLGEIFADVLGVAAVGVHDRFFDLGGDSIASMRIVARAERRGVRVTPREIYEHETVAALARVAATVGAGTPGESGGAASAAAPMTGPVTLLPIQRWFLERGAAAPDHFNLSVMLTTPDDLDEAALGRALDALVEHHGALRLRVRRNAFGWSAEVVVDDRRGTLDVSDAVGDRIAAEADEVQASLGLRDGPLLRARYFRAARRLFLVVHHLAVDAVSLGILLDDLRAAYDAARAGSVLALGPATTPIGEWGARLDAWARSDELAAQIGHWNATVAGAAAALPLDDADGDATEGAARRTTVALGADDTVALFGATSSAYRMRPHEVVAAALARAVTRWTGKGNVLVDVEGHGRHPLWDDVDLSRTVGWFTALYPVRFDAGPACDVRTVLTAAKEAMRAVPAGGVGYGVLRHLSPATPDVDRLRTAPPAAIGFNYLGALDASLAAADGADGFELVSDGLDQQGSSRHPANTRTHALVVQAQVVDGELEVDLEFDGRLRPGTVDHLAAELDAALREIADHCRRGAHAVTPSDFPLAELDQGALDRLAQTGDVEDIYELAPVQQGMLFHSLLEAGEGVYTEQLTLRIRGAMDADALRSAWLSVAGAHPVLRTAVVWEGVPRPVQVVRRDAAVELTELDWTTAPDADAALQQHLREDRRRGFVLDRAPLWRLTLARTGPSSWFLVWTHHHLLLDGWAAAIVLNEVLTAYEAHVAGVALELTAHRPYRDYVEWLRSRDPHEADAHWRAELGAVTAPTPLGIDRPDHGVTEGAVTGHGMTERVLDARASAAVDGFARAQRVTTSTLVQAAWAAVLARYAGEREVVVGVTVSGRPADLADVESMVGCFINTLPMRVVVEADQTVAEFLQHVQDRGLSLRRFEHSSLVRVRELSGVPAGQPLFESIVVFENYPISGGDDDGGLDIEFHEADERTNYPLTIVAGRANGLDLRLYWDRTRVPDAAAERLLGHLEAALLCMVAEPATRVGDLELLTDDEAAWLLDAARNDLASSPATIADLFEAQAARTPERIALTAGANALSFAELDERANRLARHLVASGAGPEVVCALACERSADLVVAHLAIAKAGAAYLPLDLEAPPDRVRFVLADAAARVLIVQDDLLPGLEGALADDLAIVQLGADRDAIDAQAGTAPPRAALSPDNLAYVMYTSGSTGTPKGVAVTHANVSRLVLGLPGIDIAGRRVMHASADSFDVTTFELWAPLVHGGTCVLHPPGLVDPSSVRTVIDEHGVDVAWLTSSLFNVAIDQDPAILDGLEVLLCGGEALSPPHVRVARGAHPRVRFVNGYGPTEVTTFTTTYDVPTGFAADAVAIGRPIGATRTYVVDREGRLAPIGVPGELWVGGAGVARGYLGQPALTAERFVPDPFSGVPGARLYRTGDVARWREDRHLDYGGRIDEQVKIRGFRVECGEVEAALAEHTAVREAAVVPRGEGASRRLVAYIVRAGGTPAAPSDLRDHLALRLPEYMVPADFVELDAFPLNRSGKLDRAALPDAERTRAASHAPYSPPQGALEEVLAGVYADVLAVAQVGRDDDFFDLGGQSLLATQVTSRVRDLFGAPVELREVFEARSVAALAHCVADRCGGAAVAGEIAAAIQQVAGLSDAEVLRLLAEGQPGEGGDG